MSTGFTGFRPEALGFLVELALNNDRSWFGPRKAEYEALLKAPLERLCSALDVEFRARGIPLAADPARSPFRIYRDVRFSKDKSPYKTNVGASFPWIGNGGGVGGYFHLEPGGDLRRRRDVAPVAGAARGVAERRDRGSGGRARRAR